MRLLEEAIEEKKFDTRMVEKFRNRGVMTEKDIQKHVDSLPDEAEHAEWVSLESIQKSDGIGTTPAVDS